MRSKKCSLSLLITVAVVVVGLAGSEADSLLDMAPVHWAHLSLGLHSFRSYQNYVQYVLVLYIMDGGDRRETL